jgi:hypothetical protein
LPISAFDPAVRLALILFYVLSRMVKIFFAERLIPLFAGELYRMSAFFATVFSVKRHESE